MSIVIPIIVFVCWCGYAAMEGNREAAFFHLISVDKKTGRGLHIVFTIQRALVLVCMALCLWKVAVACIFVFPFIHDGSYYSSRNTFDVAAAPQRSTHLYPERWFAQSTTSTALTTKFLTPVVRTLLAAAGVAFFVVQFFI